MADLRPFKLALICGGPSQERGISLNSARSVMDHLTSELLTVIPIYVDYQKQFYKISTGQLYSNTPADFDFKLKQTATKLDKHALEDMLKSVDLVFPVIHGAFGEDGELQSLLESLQVPFVGNSSACCRWMFRKDQAAKTLRENGFATLPQAVFKKGEIDHFQVIEKFFQHEDLKRAIVKPAIGGSSIGVSSVATPEEAYAKVNEIFSKGLCEHALLEPFCVGKEFTVVLFENLKGEPVALIPTEVDLSYDHHQIFDYRKKYLPTNQAVYHTPPRFAPAIVDQIRKEAEQIFKLFGMRDFVRLDGWVMPNGTLIFTDINPVSGLEQNSFLFRQAAVVGLTHRDALTYILKRACSRYGISFPSKLINDHAHSKMPVYVLFGSRNAERQVSLMSGTNVWLKLLQSKHHTPYPFLYDPQGDVWELPYCVTLNHTVEEIFANCQTSHEERQAWLPLKDKVCSQLELESSKEQSPRKMALECFLKSAIDEKAFVFIALHGGEGENGTLQRKLESYRIPFNGSHAESSALCMDKYMTGQIVQSLGDPDLQTIPKKCIRIGRSGCDHQWQEFTQELACNRLIIKPRSDGCSAGIVLLKCAEDLERYCSFIQQKIPYIPPYSFPNQSAPIEMPTSDIEEFLLEPYIETDLIVIEHLQLKHTPREGWIELTVGVLENQGIYQALNPSITIAEGAVLSLEEKFQGGTGINLTPPPEEILHRSSTEKVKRLVEKAARALGIQNYARLDVFFNRNTEKLLLIEANTLPGLTPSTVIYHQGLAEEPSLPPLALLEKMIASKLSSLI